MAKRPKNAQTEITRKRSFTLLENLDEFGRNGGQSHMETALYKIYG